MRSIRRQLTLGILLSLGLLLGGLGFGIYWAIRDSIYDQFDEALRVKALFIVTSTQQRNNQIRVDFSDGYLREFDYDIATDFFQVYDGEGKSLTRSDSLSGRDLPLRAGSLKTPLYWDLDLPTGEPGRAIGIEFSPNLQNRRGVRKEDPLIARVVVASDRSHLDVLVGRLKMTLLAAGGAMVLVIGLVVPRVLARGLRPLQALADQASRIDAHSLTERFPVATLPGELQPIARRLNDLLARLGEGFDRERRFSSNLAHELRTPLAELRSQAELALKWPEERTAENDRAVLDIALQMEALVSQMLALARAEQGGSIGAKTSVGLAPLIASILEALAPAADARGLTIVNDTPADATLVTGAVALRSILTNLLENAVNYADAGGEVRVQTALDADRFHLRVSNPAGALQPADLSRMFERFWRKDSSRSDGAHAGLGLALARSLAEQLGCTLEATREAPGLLVLTLSGPR